MELSVKAWGETIGKLVEHNGKNLFALSPNTDLLFSPIQLKEKNKLYDFSHFTFQHGVPGLINDSLPGQYGQEYLNDFFVQHFKYHPSVMETLQFIGDNTMGALTYEPSILSDKDGDGVVLQARELYTQTKLALSGKAELSLAKIIAISNSAASGARPKAIVGLNHQNKEIFVGKKGENIPDGFTHSIIKFDNLMYGANRGVAIPYEKEKISKTITEHIYAVLAKKCGISMPETSLIETDGGVHFAVERFDIKQTVHGVERLHMHSLSGLMHHNPAETTFDYMNAFRVGLKLNIPHEDMLNLYRIMIFNIVFSNKDDHSRNVSYLMDKSGKWRAAPAYDLTFTYNKHHQMLFNFRNIFEIDSKHLIHMGEEFKIHNCDEIITKIIEVKHAFLKELATQHGIGRWAEDVIALTANVDQCLNKK
jgi:serine/threonine-protein kinase HipA